MTRELEVAIAVILIPFAGFCLWNFSYWTGAVTTSVALAFSIGL